MMTMNTCKNTARRAGWLALLFTACCAWGQQPAPSDANSIDAIDVSALQNGNLVVHLTLKQPLANPPGVFTINNPPRIAFDFPGTLNGLGRTTQNVDQGELRNLNIVQAGDRTRLVLNLLQPLGYDTRIDGKNLIITLQKASAPGATPAPTTHFAEAQAVPAHHGVRYVDFKRGPNGEGRIIVDLSDTGIGIDLHQQGRSLVVDFLDTALPENLQKRYDTSSFATPVQDFSVMPQGNNARIVIDPTGLWEHSAYQTDRQFIVEVKPIVEDPSKLIQGSHAGYTGEKLSLNFQNVEVRAVLQVIADFTGFNFITSDTVTGNLTLRLKDVPWDQALDIILQTKGLDMRKNGNVVWIAPRDELLTKEKLALESQAQIADLEPLQTESFQLNYAKADQIVTLLRGGAGAASGQSIMSKRGSTSLDARTNTLFVQDTPERLEQVAALIRKVDVPVRQVMIEARIVEASDTFSRNLGVRLGVLDRKLTNNVTAGGSLDATGFLTTQVATPIPTLDQATSVNLPALGLNGATAGAFSVILFNNELSRFLNLELSALQADGKGKIISSPRVITADQVEATIEQGTEIPYQQASSSGATAVAFKKATLSLKVRPQITPDDNIIMTLDVHKDSVGTTTTAGPSIDTKQITTEVLVQNGGTVVIGGVYSQTQNDSTTKIPLFGDLPYVGFLFRQNSKQDDRNELLIFISPRIVKNDLNVH